jgi:DNA-binding CsgD family transcriptional regulator
MGYLWLLEARGRLHLARGQPDPALKDCLAAGKLLVERLSMPGPGTVAWRSGAALAAHATGDHDRADQLAREDLALARRTRAPGLIGRAQRTLARIHGGIDGLGLLQQAVANLASSQARLEHARALIDLGAAHRRAGHRADAQPPLREGLGIAERGGATALRERARIELAATGARPRKQRRTGLDSLTPSEVRTATMAASGLKNRQIAHDLFITIKAVEAHLHHAYQKLDIATRDQLTNALQEPRPTKGGQARRASA